jgi:hypothetical protein
VDRRSSYSGSIAFAGSSKRGHAYSSAYLSKAPQCMTSSGRNEPMARAYVNVPVFTKWLSSTGLMK